jgi:flagellar FliL protein
MATADETSAEAPPVQRSRLPLILGALAALVLGGAGFFATWSGMIGGGHEAETAPEAEKAGNSVLPDVAFVAVAPLTVSLAPGGRNRHLRFAAELEVPKAHAAEVQLLLPRVVDVLNAYLRAVEAADLEDPAALVRIRAQMLRRIQMVTGEGRVNDLLVTEFVLN